MSVLATGGGGGATVSYGTITASNPFSITQTWNNAAVSFVGAVVDITDTASANTSVFFDVKQSGVSRFRVGKSATTNQVVMTLNGGDVNPCTFVVSGNSLGIGASNNQDVTLATAFTVTRLTGAIGGGRLTSTQTWNNAAGVYSAFAINLTNTASAAGSTLAKWSVGGVQKFAVGLDGALSLSGGLTMVPPASATPASNGELVFEATSNTQVKVKYKGSDGVVRSATLTLS